jgi:hypothetical protein
MDCQLWQIDNFGHPKLPIGIPNFVPFRPILEKDAIKSIEEKKISMDFLNTWNFSSWVCARMTIMIGRLSICGLLTKIIRLFSRPLPPQNSTLLEGF